MGSSAKAPSELGKPTAGLASSFRMAVGISLLLSVFTYLVVCIVCSAALSYLVPLSEYDLDNSSWLGLSPLDFNYYVKIIGSLLILTLALSVLIRRVAAAALAAFLVIVLFGAGSQGNSLRLGVLQGDARVGCFAYKSLECRKMLNAPTQGAPSIFSAHEGARGEAQYASWYQSIRASVKSDLRNSISSAIPGFQLIASPWLIAHSGVLNTKLETQRAALKVVRSSSAP